MSDTFDPLPLGEELQRIAQRKRVATVKGGQAFMRLLQLAETHDSGQAHRVARFIAATFDREAFPFESYALRLVDEAIGDDMLLCLDALRWGQADLHRLVPDGDLRVRALIDQCGLKWPDAS